jgi:hypothetical protein
MPIITQQLNNPNPLLCIKITQQSNNANNNPTIKQSKIIAVQA